MLLSLSQPVWWVLVLAGLVTQTLAVIVDGQNNGAAGIPDAVPNEYIVVMKKNVNQSDIQAHYDSVLSQSLDLPDGMRGFVRGFQIGGFNAYHLQCDQSTLQDIQAHDLVDYVSPNGFARVQTPVPAPPSSAVAGDIEPLAYNHPWGLARISHEVPDEDQEGYVRLALPSNSTVVRVYVADTGIRTTHSEFVGRAQWGKTFVDGEPDYDDNGHGTHVTGTILGMTVGVENSAIAIAVKVLGEDGSGPYSAIIAGIEWAVSDAQNTSSLAHSVINLSVGGGPIEALNDAVSAAVSAGMVVVVAAGNDNSDACSFSPSSAPAAITVAAIDEYDKRASFSNFGSCVDIFAPGCDILSSFNNDTQGYAVLSGTSMASPHVAGLAAYFMSREYFATPLDVKAKLTALANWGMIPNANSTNNLIAFNGGQQGTDSGDSMVFGFGQQ